MRVLLCEQKPSPERSLLLNIVQHMLNAEGSVALSIVVPAGRDDAHAVIALDELDEVLAATHPDILLVLADTVGLERARTVAKTHGTIEVLAITRTGYLMLDLDPRRLAAVLRALVAARQVHADGLAVANAGHLRVES